MQRRWVRRWRSHQKRPNGSCREESQIGPVEAPDALEFIEVAEPAVDVNTRDLGLGTSIAKQGDDTINLCVG